MSQLLDQLQAVLFVASEPLSAKQLAATTTAPVAEVETALTELIAAMQGGIRLSHHAGKYRLVTAPDTAATVRQFLQDETKTELSRPALETLAIVAYRGPLTKSAIEQIRGVSSDTILRNLMARGLITEAGKSTEPGRPLFYAVSHNFLQQFGLTDVRELPSLETPEAPHED